MTFRHGLVGSADALFELFSTPLFVPHGASWHLPRATRRKLRRKRLLNWTWTLRKKHARARLERFGLDVDGDKATVARERRLLRNARKQERRAAR